MKRSTRRALDRRLPRLMNMSESFRSMLRAADAREQEVGAQMILHYDASVQRALAKHPDRLGIAAGAHDAMDRSIRGMLSVSPHAGEVKCKKGCSSCCRMNVDVSRAEAQLLAACAEDLEVPVDRERLRRQSAGFAHLAPEDRACVFLDAEGACRVYEHRPGACRKLLVVTDPDLCDTVKHPRGQVGGLGCFEAEVIWTVLQTRDHSGPLAQMLLEELPP